MSDRSPTDRDDDDRSGLGRRATLSLLLLLAGLFAYSAATTGRAAELDRLAALEMALDRQLSELFEAQTLSYESPEQSAPTTAELWKVHRAAQSVRDRITELEAEWPWGRRATVGARPPLPAAAVSDEDMGGACGGS